MNTPAVQDAKEEPVEALAQPDAVLRVLEALQQGHIPAPHRILLEGFAFLASQLEFRQKNCRVFKAFNKEQWQLELHESLNYLEQARQVKRDKGKYSLTPLGTARLDPILAGGPTQKELREIQHLAQRVIVGLDL
ncbi:hypothetical protein [Candidatus Poriferisodalis sp.]|uniref:hypothetical protein n=1 Tax=Candidatus Poriferisodalis sp. TaxID=3101277 RepID=UPI003B02D32C